MVEAGHSRRYVNENVHRIRKVFRWAASEQMIPSSVPQDLATVDGLRKGHSQARETAPVTPVDDKTVDATLPHLPKVVADMVRLQRLTGARPGEICSMRPVDVDRTGETWKYVPAEHKTEHHGNQRVIFIGPKAQAILLPYLLRDAEASCFSPADSEKNRRAEVHTRRVTPMSCGNVPKTDWRRKRNRAPGGCYTNDSYRRAIARGCELAFGMPKELRKIDKDLPAEEQADLKRQAAAWRAENVWFPHQLRHSAATNIRHRFGLEAAQAALGHTRLEVTQIYAERNNDLAARVAREVG
jgi:integrase